MNEYKVSKFMKSLTGVAVVLMGTIFVSLLGLAAILIWAGIWTVLGGAF